MSMSTFQKVTLATCLVLCVALLLPKMLLSRGKKDAERPEGPGRFPPMVHRQMAPDSQGQRAAGSNLPRAHNTEAIARAKGAGTGAGAGGKSNLAGQIIPIYGFGILLYILYILFKITSKGNTKPSENRFPSVRSENMKRKITDFELAQLQEKLQETEMVMEHMVSKANHSHERVKGVTPDQEENLLLQLREITRVMQEGRLVEGVAPEMKQQDDWEDYTTEPGQCWGHSYCPCHHGQQSNMETEAESERTEADGADLVESDPEHLQDVGETEQPEDLNKDEETQHLLTAGDEEVEQECNSATDENKNSVETEEGEGKIILGVTEEDLAGVLEELELTLKMTSTMEQEKMEVLAQPEPAATRSTNVRRRNRKKRAKRD